MPEPAAHGGTYPGFCTNTGKISAFSRKAEPARADRLGAVLPVAHWTFPEIRSMDPQYHGGGKGSGRKEARYGALAEWPVCHGCLAQPCMTGPQELVVIRSVYGAASGTRPPCAANPGAGLPASPQRAEPGHSNPKPHTPNHRAKRDTTCHRHPAGGHFKSEFAWVIIRTGYESALPRQHLPPSDRGRAGTRSRAEHPSSPDRGGVTVPCPGNGAGRRTTIIPG